MEVVYDEFRTDDTVVENANTTGSAQVIKQNTRATVEDDDAFVRLGLENPNSYAVAFEVQLSEEIVRPATLGTVRATDTDGVTADWQAQHDFEAEDTHARHGRRPGRDGRALHAEPTTRVKSLSWTGEAEQSAETLRERVTTLWEDDRLEQRTYQVTGSEGGSSRSTSKTRRRATGSRSGTPPTRSPATKRRDPPARRGTGEPVFYRPIENDDGTVDAIQVTFNEAGTVSLTVEPTTTEKLGIRDDELPIERP